MRVALGSLSRNPLPTNDFWVIDRILIGFGLKSRLRVK